MIDIDEQLKNNQKIYRNHFLKFANDLNEKIYSLKPQMVEGEIFDTFPKNSAGQNWQKDTLKYIKNNISPEIFKEIYRLKKLREDKKYNCKMCGSCCKLAISEFSPQDLKSKSENSDKFATQFLSVFIPYENIDEARKIFPEYVDYILKNSEKVYFYHCPKVTTDNRCPIYDKRPQICKDFPDNPFSFLPKNCGFKDWKSDITNDALKYFAQAEIVEFYVNRLNSSLQ